MSFQLLGDFIYILGRVHGSWRLVGIMDRARLKCIIHTVRVRQARLVLMEVIFDVGDIEIPGVIKWLRLFGGLIVWQDIRRY